jgi:hypothetical protein
VTDNPSEVVKQHQLQIELLQLLGKIEAPDYAYKSIMDWAHKAASNNFDFKGSPVHKCSVLDNLCNKYNLTHMHPHVKTLNLENIEGRVPVITFDFKAMLMSLLVDTTVMQPENLVINNSDDPSKCDT